MMGGAGFLNTHPGDGRSAWALLYCPKHVAKDILIPLQFQHLLYLHPVNYSSGSVKADRQDLIPDTTDAETVWYPPDCVLTFPK